MNQPPSSPIRIVPPDHTNDGTNPACSRAVLSLPVAWLAGANNHAEPAQPPSRPLSARSFPPGRADLFANTTGDTPASAGGTLQSP
jgi:hypothetical protein